MDKLFDIGQFVPVLTEQTVIAELVKRVKQRRKELGLTQKELSIRSGVSYGSLKRFESTGEISLAFLIKIGNALQCLEDFNKLFAEAKITDLKDYCG